MNINSLVFFIPGFLLLSTACTTQTEIPFTPVSNPDNANLYIYRPMTLANALYSPQITLNAENKGVINNDQVISAELAQGKNLITLNYTQTFIDHSELELMATQGTNYYVRVNSTLKLNNSSDTYTKYERGYELQIVEADKARREIAKCCHSITSKIESTTTQTVEDDINQEGFSSDKTHNPFGH